ncbi:hypothetical protein G432_05210 [Sphingomonas sp. MM-1]|uniref:GTA-gp10 family protein n=1 Tax=Sphingomonas sp. MM-1 TaxID=745310 RepID=UPI0002C0B909|nr:MULTISPECIES: GTA-gp10 family protein [unclassified Sphingomonas]AGH48769.1 hypothetical protein G432_05210 [Sphingomonas sp. MM-1]MDX3884028.1 hypothetical protein [Sphingomonas sp.]
MAANSERGEVSVTLGKKERVLRPSFTAIVLIEKQTGRSLRELAAMANSMTMPIDVMAIVVAELVRAGAAKDDVGAQMGEAEKWGQLIYAAGIPVVAARLTIVLTAALTGGATVEGELKPVATTETESAATGD